MSPVLILYLALTSAASPVACWLCKPASGTRARRMPSGGRAHGPRLVSRPARGVLVWCHAASVGESLSLLPLIERLRAEGPQISSPRHIGHRNLGATARRWLPNGVIHQFVPVDVRPAVERFLDHWRPDLGVWIESEIWPRLVISVGKRGIPALLLNARLGARSRARWRRAPRTAADLFSVFQHIQAQDLDTAEALRELGIPPERINVAGSFKDAAPPLPCDAVELERLRAAVCGRLVWVAASTHPGEDEIIVEAHAAVLQERADALLIIVPRHPERGNTIATSLHGGDLNCVQRTCSDAPSPEASIYLADTLGELGLWYRLSDAAFVAGSLTDVGGHNPYEPAALHVPILHGPDTRNFADIYSTLDAAGGARRIASARELARSILELADTPAGSDLSARAARVLHARSDALESAVRLVLARVHERRASSGSDR